MPTYHQPNMPVPYKITPRAFPFPLCAVRLLDGPFEHAQELDAKYLLSLSADRLLSRFRSNAGLTPKGPAYGGWESEGVSGHTLGHYLSACSLMYASTGDKRFKGRAAYVVRELDECQQAAGDGFLGAMPNGREVFARVAKGDITSAGFDLNGSWVPWYNEHKTFAGLIDACLYTGNQDAKRVLLRLADWAVETTKALTDDQWQRMLACEHGGMNDALADVYALSGDTRYLDLARKFYHKAVLDPLSRREDKLTGLHANTQIPKTIGAARLYELTGEDKFQTIASFFWDDVTKDRSYVIGGNSDGEHFPPKEEMSKHIGPSTTETCNTYNMLKLTRHLFSWNPRAEYADYYERALFNHILASQNPDDGMMCYYVPLKTGVPKAYNTPFDSFWCCTGTGMENHAKYGDSIYFRGAGDDLYVNLFIASELTWAEKGVGLQQVTGFPEKGTALLRFTCTKPAELALHIRRPYWATKGFTLLVNGSKELIRSKPGTFVTVHRTWKTGDTVEIAMPMTVREEPMRDNPRKVALMYGPLVLAARVDPSKPSPVLIEGAKTVTAALKPLPGQPGGFRADSAVFRSSEARAGMTLHPFYKVYKTPYIVYWDQFSEGEWKAREAEYRAEQDRKKALDARTVDTLDIGEMQPERDHHVTGEKTSAGDFNGRKWRHATDGGWFAFDMKVDPRAPVDLVCTYWGGDANNREFDVLVDGEKIASQVLENNKPGTFYDQVYAIPERLTTGKASVSVRFQARPGKWAGGLYGCRIIRREAASR